MSPVTTAVHNLARAGGLSRSGRTFESPPTQTKPDGPPPRLAFGGEALSGLQVLRLIASSPRLLSAPRGDGSIVFDLPGWRAPEISMLPIRRYLRWLGYDARTWGLGTNRGSVEDDVEELTHRVADAADDSGRSVSLVGWSLGGVVAREVARRIPQSVAGVVTFGSPVVGGPSHTHVARYFTEEESERAERLIEELDRESPVGVPVTAIYTKRDGVVNWRACIDRSTPGVRHVEVNSSHMGLGIDPDVWLATAEALPEGG
ncbi:MAG: esterase/lipase family protein [Solirubrobacterales bacterium]